MGRRNRYLGRLWSRYCKIASSASVLMSRPSSAACALSRRFRASGSNRPTFVYASSDRLPVFSRFRRGFSVTPQNVTSAELSDTLRPSRRLNVLTVEQIRDILVTGRHTTTAAKSKPLAGLLADTREGRRSDPSWPSIAIKPVGSAAPSTVTSHDARASDTRHAGGPSDRVGIHA